MGSRPGWWFTIEIAMVPASAGVPIMCSLSGETGETCLAAQSYAARALVVGQRKETGKRDRRKH
jgi:hypothetical protein